MAGYIGPIPVPQATQSRETFTATASQTSFGTAGYQVGYLDVFMNGVKLAPADFTATNGSDVVLASGAAVNDIIEVVSYSAFEVLNQNFTGTTTVADLTVTGDLTVDGTTTTINSTTLNVDDINITVASGAADAAAANGAGLTVDGANATFNYASSGDKWTMNKDLDITGTLTSDGLTVDNGSSGQSKITISEGGVNNRNLVLYSPALGGTSSKIAVEGTTADLDFVVNNGAQTAIRIGGSTGDITFYDTDGTTASFVYDANAGTTFNEAGNDRDFRVESDGKQKMLFVDGGENVVAVGMLDNYTTPSWVGNGSFVMADNLYQFQGANTGAGVWNQSVDTNQSYHMHNAYYSGGWKQHVANVSATMYQSGSGLHRFQVANANSSADASISWRPLLNMNEAHGFDWNPSDYSAADFRVRSDSYANMLLVDAGQNSFQVGSYSNKDGNIMTVGGSQSQTYSSSAAEGQLAVSLVNNANGNNQHSGLFFRVSSNNGSNNANASIGLKQPSYTSHNGQVYFNLRSQSQNNFRQYGLIDSETGWIFNDGNESYIDFRVESDGNANMLFVDAGNNAVCINTNSITEAPLNIQCDTSARAIRIVGRSDDYAEIDFFENDNTTQLVRLQAHNTYFQIRT